jgi:hypothetical protein
MVDVLEAFISSQMDSIQLFQQGELTGDELKIQMYDGKNN